VFGSPRTPRTVSGGHVTGKGEQIARTLPLRTRGMGSIMTLDLFPLGIVLLVAVTAASAAYLSLRQATLGRTRHALAYLAGLLAGLTATLALATLLPALAITDTPIAEAGMLASFLAPFAGMAHAELRKLADEESSPPKQPVSLNG
jgi:hypothetical protein